MFWDYFEIIFWIAMNKYCKISFLEVSIINKKIWVTMIVHSIANWANNSYIHSFWIPKFTF